MSRHRTDHAIQENLDSLVVQTFAHRFIHDDKASKVYFTTKQYKSCLVFNLKALLGFVGKGQL